ncbi:MAG: tripartite tricarboxylate transporter substrate binding protein [Burkholderiaceae bacterium]
MKRMPSCPARSRRTLLTALSALTAGAGLAGLPSTTRAQGAGTYPNKPVRLVVPFPPGGATDLTGRLLAGKLAEVWKQSVIVENRPGASGMIGTELVAKAPADGYTILVPITTHIQNAAVYAKLSYEPFKDFEPISKIADSYLALCVRAESPIRTLEDFVAYGKKQGGKSSFGSFGNGSSSHIVGERFSRVAGLGLTHVPYKGASPLATDLLGGQVDSAWIDVSTATAHLQAGKLRALAVTGPRRAPMLPDVPTLAEKGYSGFEPLGWVGVMVASGTPKPIVDAISNAIQQVMKMPDVQARLNEQTLVPVGNLPAEFAAQLKTESAQWLKIAQDAGITPQ